MYFVYDIGNVPYRNVYYTSREIFDIPLSKFDTIEDLEMFLEENENYWPVHSCLTESWIPVKCSNEDEARQHLLESLNRDIYEKMNDL